jgi:phenylalanine-4-hydroxylase
MLTTQDYSSYTAEDFEVWGSLFRRQLDLLRGRVCDEFFDCVEALRFGAGAIPRLEQFSDRLEELSGWRVQAVDGQLPGRDYWGLIGNRCFPSITRIRPLDELGHAALPDMFHDLFGHIPLLLLEPYSEFLREMSLIALDHLEDEERMRRHGRVYKWTIEYGLMDTGAGVRVYGAGLISSSDEVEHSLGDAVRRRPFDVRAAMDTHHTPASLQEQYFAIDSFEQLVESLPAVRQELSASPAASPAA